MKNTVIHRLYPLTKFFSLLFLAIFCLLLPVPFWKFIVSSILFFSLNAVAKNLLVFYRKLFKVMLVLSLAIFLINGLFHQSEETLFTLLGFLSFKTEGVQLALHFIVNMYVVLGTIMTFFNTTSMEDFMVSLERAHLPFPAAYTILSTFQIIPDLGRRSKIIMEAQNARGIETEGKLLTRVKAFVPMVSPLIISSITELNEKVITLEARGFSAGIPRSSISDLRIKTIDYFVLLVCIICTVSYLIGRTYLWVR